MKPISENAWVLTAIQDLQELASQQSPAQVNAALDGVCEIAKTELRHSLEQTAKARL